MYSARAGTGGGDRPGGMAPGLFGVSCPDGGPKPVRSICAVLYGSDGPSSHGARPASLQCMRSVGTGGGETE